MVDCRSLIEFCGAFKQHNNMKPKFNRNNHDQSPNFKKSTCNSNSVNPLYYPFCEQSYFAAIDILMLILVIGSLGFLIIPYMIDILPLAFEVTGEVLSDAPAAYLVCLIAAFSIVIASIASWEIIEIKSRKCGKLNCKGLRKAIEFEIQLESEECVKYSSLRRSGHHGLKQLELGKDHNKELEAELKKMVPVNGRTVLIVRAQCGCPAGKLEVWSAKRVSRVKK